RKAWPGPCGHFGGASAAGTASWLPPGGRSGEGAFEYGEALRHLRLRGRPAADEAGGDGLGVGAVLEALAGGPRVVDGTGRAGGAVGGRGACGEDGGRPRPDDRRR